MGLEAAVIVEGPGNCPVADASDGTGASVRSVVRSSAAGGEVVEEFELDADDDPPAGTREAFAGEDHTVVRFERDADRGCVCDRIEAFGCPVADVAAVEGRLRVVFRPPDAETLREIVGTLREAFDGVRLERLVRSRGPTGGEPVVVDRGRLTDRQREVLETAYEMGYFDHPKGANAEEVAAALGVNSATFRGHVAAAQSKLLGGSSRGDGGRPPRPAGSPPSPRRGTYTTTIECHSGYGDDAPTPDMVRASETASDPCPSAGTQSGELPALAGVRPRSHDPASGDPTVEVRFENGARVCYRASEEGLREEWFGPGDDVPARSHAVAAPVAHDGEAGASGSFEGRPPTRVLADRALCTLSTYLSFDDRAQAEFVWGDDNVAALLAE